jgi:2-iminobutanoate/2-iminopropanoate deaminase
MNEYIVSTDNAPKAVGPYSQGCVAGGILFISGQLPVDPATGVMTTDDIKEATRQCLKNVLAIAKASGESAHLVKVNIYLKDMSQFAQMNEAYTEFFPTNPPARACVEASRLPKDAPIEIEAVAYLS